MSPMLEALRGYWLPVALSEEVRDQPFASQLLGERVAVYRAAGKAHVVRDLCIHRGTPLSLGWVDGEDLVCAYHGWSYGPNGACTRIPSLQPGRPIPAKARVETYATEERYGLVWAALGEPRAPVPPYPQAEDPSFRTIWMQYRWKASAPRVVENVMDFAHFPWVHPGILGHRERPVYPDVKPVVDGNEIRYTVDDAATNAIRDYRVTLPLALQMTVRRRTSDPVAVPAKASAGAAAPEAITAMLFVARPVTETETVFYFGHARNFALDQDDAVWAERNTSVTEQDRRIVEAQRPELLPVDLGAELHLRGSDAPAVEYRRALARLGIEG